MREDAMVRGTEIVPGDRMRFRALREGAGTLEITLNLPGRHNVQNALAAIAVATELGVPDAAIRKALAEFRGVGRRFQRYGEIPVSLNGKASGSFTLVDDYGHHPVEMRATLDAARGAFPGRRIVLAFQPHRYTRTRDLFEDFVKALSDADALLLAEVYPAGETPIVAADGRSLARAIRVAGKTEPVFVERIADMPDAIRKIVRPGDVVLTMGAGSIGGVPAALARTGR
jgi:UDP-N-acetylmuramate--alanine ligase